MGWICPESFEPSEKTIAWAKSKGLSESQIRDELEAMKDYEYPKKRTDWDRCFRTWIRNGFAWGRITPSTTRQTYKPEELTDEQRQQDIEKFEADMKKLGVSVMKR